MDSRKKTLFYDSVPTREKPVSVHRAFIYGASLPGLGEYYAGHRLRGLTTGLLFLTAIVWFSGTLYVAAGELLDYFMTSLKGGVTSMPDLPLFELAASFGLLYLAWLWAIIRAVDTGVKRRRQCGLADQTSIAWSTAMSWICPGAGNVYTGSRRYGYMLFCANLLALLALVPAYLKLFNGLLQIVNNSNFSPNNPYPIIALIHGLMVRLGFSFGKLYQAGVRYIAIAGTISDLSQQQHKEDRR